MKSRRLALWILLASLPHPLGSEPDRLSRKLAALEERYRESLVQVRYTQRVKISSAEPPRVEDLTTTGVVVSVDGVVMVSGIIFEPFNQVPHGVGIRFPATVTQTEPTISEARVRMADGSEYAATLAGRDTEADVAFFRVEAEDRTFRPVDFDTEGAARVGQQVAVVSLLPDLLGPAVAVELARVQAVVRKPAEGFLVGTGAADPVGSLVCDLEGNLVGWLDALTVPVPESSPRNPLSLLSVLRDLPKGIGRGFARPARRYAEAAGRPPQKTPLRRGWLGVEMQALTPELGAHLRLPVPSGIILGYVYRRSPAEKAGLVTGDILVELGSQPIGVSREEDLGSFAEKILRAGPGAEFEITYLRDGQLHGTVATIALAPRSAREAKTMEVEELDLTVREVTYDYLARRNLEPDKEGVVVVEGPVAVGANPNRIIRGDLLVRLSDRETRDLASFREVVEVLRRERPGEVVLFVERGSESFFFAVKPEWN
ncbi:MAG: S1C family serine protease [Acidobacteriota bacterium]